MDHASLSSTDAALPAPHPLQRYGALLVVTIATVGVALSFLGAAQAGRAQDRMLALRFERDALEHVKMIAGGVEDSLETIRSVRDFMQVEPDPSQEDYDDFVAPALARHPQIDGVGYALHVAHADRPAMEARLTDHAGPPMTILERDADGTLVPAGERPEYFVALRAAPLERMARIYGFDSYSDPSRRVAIDRARETGELAATAVVRLFQDTGGEPGFIVMAPVYDEDAPQNTVEQRRAAMVGLVGAGFRIHTMIKRSLPPEEIDLLAAEAWDVTDSANPVLLYQAQRPAASAGLAHTRDLPVAGPVWRVTFWPTEAYLRETRSPEAAAVLPIGLVLTLLAAGLFWTTLRYGDQALRFARERERTTRELEARVAEREDAERIARVANDELRTLNQEMEQFVSAVSHDLKNPLLAVEWTTAALRRTLQADGPPKARESVENIAQAAGSMRRIIDDLLAHSRAGYAPFRPERVDVAEVVRRVLAERTAQIARCEVDVEVGELPVVTADRGRLTAALDNLIGNALKYGCTAERPRLVVGSETHPGEVRLFVQDNGPGVPPEQREAVFKLFQRLAKDDDGTGIGLAIVERVARAHRGRAWVDDAPGPEGGARFWLSIPTLAV